MQNFRVALSLETSPKELVDWVKECTDRYLGHAEWSNNLVIR